MAKSLEELQQAVIKFRDERDWKQFHNPKDSAISLLLEASELLEHFQWKNNGEIDEHIQQKGDEVAEEVIDVLYWVLLIAHDLKINIPDTMMKKLEKNALNYPVSKAKGKHNKYTEYKVQPVK